MTAWNTNLYPNEGAGAGKSSNVQIPSVKLMAGKLRYAEALYVANGNEAANDTINVLGLKQGSRVKMMESEILTTTPSANANLVLNIGDTNNAIRYSNGLTAFGNAAANSVLRSSFSNCTSPLLTTLFAPNDIFQGGANNFPPIQPLAANDEAVVVAKIVSVSNLPANAKVLFHIAYVDE